LPAVGASGSLGGPVLSGSRPCDSDSEWGLSLPAWALCSDSEAYTLAAHYTMWVPIPPFCSLAPHWPEVRCVLACTLDMI
jgi:hypothetical protein